MVATAGYKARILNGDFSLSAYLSDATGALSAEMLDVTTFADNGTKKMIPGLDSSTFSASGFIEAAAATDSAAWADAQPLTYGPQGFAIASQVLMFNSIKSSYEAGTQVGSAASFSLAGTTDGPASNGVTLHDLTAETVDVNGTTHDGAAASTNGGVGHLHVTAYSGFTSVSIIVEDSADGTTWATIGTFTSVTAVTASRLAITGTIRRYTRVRTDVTLTGSVTFAAFLARH